MTSDSNRPDWFSPAPDWIRVEGGSDPHLAVDLDHQLAPDSIEENPEALASMDGWQSVERLSGVTSVHFGQNSRGRIYMAPFSGVRPLEMVHSSEGRFFFGILPHVDRRIRRAALNLFL